MCDRFWLSLARENVIYVTHVYQHGPRLRWDETGDGQQCMDVSQADSPFTLG